MAKMEVIAEQRQFESKRVRMVSSYELANFTRLSQPCRVRDFEDSKVFMFENVIKGAEATSRIESMAKTTSNGFIQVCLCGAVDGECERRTNDSKCRVRIVTNDSP